ncbi:hypothetical protein ABGV42_00775 [Paenibacillus pabuli]|uniref:hypothetical protein n=1 Tax=Paenibacillus pabuli TaxID=1472 RepID=UPI003242A4B4
MKSKRFYVPFAVMATSILLLVGCSESKLAPSESNQPINSVTSSSDDHHANEKSHDFTMQPELLKNEFLNVPVTIASFDTDSKSVHEATGTFVDLKVDEESSDFKDDAGHIIPYLGFSLDNAGDNITIEPQSSAIIADSTLEDVLKANEGKTPEELTKGSDELLAVIMSNDNVPISAYKFTQLEYFNTGFEESKGLVLDGKKVLVYNLQFKVVTGS